MTILKTTAFVGLVGGVALERFLEWLKPIIDELEKNSHELAKDLRDAAQAYQNGDELGSTRFH